MVTTTLDKAGRIVLPKTIREELQLRAGDTLVFEVGGDQVSIRALPPEPQLRKDDGIWVLHGAGRITPADVRRALHRTRQQRSRRSSTGLD